MVYDSEAKLTPEQGRTVTEIRARNGSSEEAAAAVGLDVRAVMQWAAYHGLGGDYRERAAMTWPLRKAEGLCIACGTRPPLEGSDTCCPECGAAVERWRAGGMAIQTEVRVLDMDPVPAEVWDSLPVMDGRRKVTQK